LPLGDAAALVMSADRQLRLGTVLAHPLIRKGGEKNMSADHWEFYLDARGLWCWRRLHNDAGVISDSKRCFPTRSDCIDDAVKHGYVARSARRDHVKGAKLANVGSPLQERRRSSAADGQ
jgi:hypothetical protein